MIKVKDIDGKEVSGVYSLGYGSFIVDNQQEYQRYLQQTSDKKKLISLENELSDIKELLKQLLNDKNRS